MLGKFDYFLSLLIGECITSEHVCVALVRPLRAVSRASEPIGLHKLPSAHVARCVAINRALHRFYGFADERFALDGDNIPDLQVQKIHPPNVLSMSQVSIPPFEHRLLLSLSGLVPEELPIVRIVLLSNYRHLRKRQKTLP